MKECVFVATFIIGLVILFGGAALYGRFCEKVFGPDDRQTPAYAKQDGVDFIPMQGWKNSLINLLNIAGTGPILGPIQGILFGPIAFITIPIGNVIGGAMHDYFSGMICLRDGGTQMPQMIKRYSNKGIFNGSAACFCCWWALCSFIPPATLPPPPCSALTASLPPSPPGSFTA